jgi:hypothetical protein
VRVGGTSIDEWSSDKPDKLYAAAVRRAKVALKDGTLAGILWHQGEADAGKADAYPAKAVKLFADFRRDLAAGDHVPIVVGTIGEFKAEGEKAVGGAARGAGAGGGGKAINKAIGRWRRWCRTVRASKRST